MPDPVVALIMTLHNEEQGLARLLASIERQSLLPDEIVVCDSGSTDQTLQILNRWQAPDAVSVKIIEAPGANIAAGRNLAIGAADAAIICVTDGGCVLDDDWLLEICRPLRASDGQVGIVYGLTVAVGQSRVGRQFAVLHTIKVQGKKNSELEHSSRSVAFRKSAWQTAGGYPEWMSLAGEDTYFFRQVERFSQGRKAAAAKVFWYHGEESLIKIFQKHKRNSTGDGEAVLMPSRYLGLTGAYLAIAAGVSLSVLSRNILLPALIGLLLVCFRHVPAMLKRKPGLMNALLIMPAITFFRDMGMTTGYLIGFQRRLSKRVICHSSGG